MRRRRRKWGRKWIRIQIGVCWWPADGLRNSGRPFWPEWGFQRKVWASSASGRWCPSEFCRFRSAWRRMRFRNPWACWISTPAPPLCWPGRGIGRSCGRWRHLSWTGTPVAAPSSGRSHPQCSSAFPAEGTWARWGGAGTRRVSNSGGVDWNCPGGFQLRFRFRFRFRFQFRFRVERPTWRGCWIALRRVQWRGGCRYHLVHPVIRTMEADRKSGPEVSLPVGVTAWLPSEGSAPSGANCGGTSFWPPECFRLPVRGHWGQRALHWMEHWWTHFRGSCWKSKMAESKPGPGRNWPTHPAARSWSGGRISGWFYYWRWRQRSEAAVVPPCGHPSWWGRRWWRCRRRCRVPCRSRRIGGCGSPDWSWPMTRASAHWPAAVAGAEPRAALWPIACRSSAWPPPLIGPHPAILPIVHTMNQHNESTQWIINTRQLINQLCYQKNQSRPAAVDKQKEKK